MRGVFGLTMMLGLIGCEFHVNTTTLYPAGETEHASPLANEPIETLNDPLLVHQWYLHNSGDYRLTSSPVVTEAGEDIGVLAAGISPSLTLSARDYALGYSGRGVQVAVIDSGLQLDHPDLVENVVINGSYNFAYPNNGLAIQDASPVESEREDHGTSVAGLIGARGGNGIGLVGVAPAAQLKGFNMLQNQTLENELAALGFNDPYRPGLYNQNVSVFNMSYGYNPTQVELTIHDKQSLAQIEAGTKTLRQGKGALYIKAVGNEYDDDYAFDGSGWCQSARAHEVTCFNTNMEPVNTSPFLIAVGAFNAQGERASYSNTGSAIWLSAPGGEDGSVQPALLSTDLAGCARGYATSSKTLSFDNGRYSVAGEYLNAACDYTARFNGTSAAAPIVSGAVALLLEANPDLTWRDVKHILAATARKIQPSLAAKTLNLSDGALEIEQGWITNQAGFHFSNAFGFGALNLQAALQMALDWKHQARHLPPLIQRSLSKQTLAKPQSIKDASAQGVSLSQTVTGTETVESVLLHISISAVDQALYNVSSTYQPPDLRKRIDISDYLIQLTSPSGTSSILLTPFNAFKSGFDMHGMRLVSHAFYGEPIAGEWTLQIWDVNNHLISSTPLSYDNAIKHPGEGQLTDWQLTFYGHQP